MLVRAYKTNASRRHYEPIKSTDHFKRLAVRPELHTLTWPNGADFAPEFLYEKIKVPA